MENLIKCTKKQSVYKKCEKIHIGWNVLQKRVPQESKNDTKMLPKVTKNVGAGGKTRMEKQAFLMEDIAKTKVSIKKELSNS